MQAQITRRLQRQYHFNRRLVVILAALALLTLGLISIQLLSDGESTSGTRELSPVAVPVVEDPPLPADWVDPYVTRSLAKPDITTLNLDRDGADVFPAGDVSKLPDARLDRSAAPLGTGFTAEDGVVSAGEAIELPIMRLDRASAIEDGMGLTQERDAGVAAPQSPAQPAGGVQAPPMSADDIRFIEENTYGIPPMLPPAGQQGQLDY